MVTALLAPIIEWPNLMPYKDVERKKEWERLHRPQRLARRRELRRVEAAQRASQRKAPSTQQSGVGFLVAPQPSTWHGRAEQISLDQVGCEARKIPAEGDVFFLDFYLYRTNRDLTTFCQRSSRRKTHGSKILTKRHCGLTQPSVDFLSAVKSNGSPG